MLFAKNDILRTWLSKAKSNSLRFFGNKTNRTAVQIFDLNDTEQTPEIVCPYGTWHVDVRFRFNREQNPTAFITLFVNGQPIQLNFNVPTFEGTNSMDKVIHFPGSPYVERSDTFAVRNDTGEDKLQVYFIFHRIMLADT